MKQNMQPDFAEVKRFLLDCPPFDALTDEQRNGAIEQLKAAYVNEHNVDKFFNDFSPALYIVRSGAFDLLAPDGHLIERLESHDLFGYPSLLSGRSVVNRLTVVEDGIIFIVSQPTFDRLRRDSKVFEQYFIRAHSQRSLEEVARGKPNSRQPVTVDPLQTSIHEVLTRPLVQLPSTTSIRTAAQKMSDEKVSSILLVDDGALVGILTDRDLRNRVIAPGLSFDLHVNAVMTQAPATVSGRQTLMDALTTMTQNNIHHLPVLDENDQPIGMITNTDLMRQQRSEPVMLISALNKTLTREQLIAEAKQIPAYMQAFASRAANTTVVGRLLASLTDTMTRKLIEFYEREHGVAPASYAWLAFGSQGREDQTLSSDQDNGLLLADDLNDRQASWFEGLGAWVCSGLGDCGIPLCPGNIMASNPECRRSVAGWVERFTRWTESPTPKALMHCQIFFDSRMVVGNKRLYQRYRAEVAKLGQNEFFLGNLARLQRNVQVPLGLFNRFRGTESGKDSDLIDIKRYGIALINDIVRIYSLQAGLTEPRTLARLEQLLEGRLLNRRDNQSLAEAWQFLTQLRLQHQLEVWGTDEPKNALDPDQLSTLVRRQLKTAFRIIDECQQGVAMKFGRSG